MNILGRAVLFLALAVASARAEPSAPPSATGATLSPELAAVDRFLRLTDAELAQSAEAIARVRAMTVEQRAALRDEIAKYRRLPERERMQLRKGWGWMPAEIQNGWRDLMQHASPEERAAIQAKLQSLGPEQKTSYRRALVEAYLKAQRKD